MAASNPLHRDASASRQPSTHSLHCFTARNAALPSHKVEGLIDPLRPWSGSRSCGGPPRPLPLPFAHALRADTRTLTAARARAVRVQPCHRILEATTMRRTAGIENNIGTRVERREKGSDRLPPYLCVDSGIRVTPSFRFERILPNKHNPIKSPKTRLFRLQRSARGAQRRWGVKEMSTDTTGSHPTFICPDRG